VPPASFPKGSERCPALAEASMILEMRGAQA
jgi:hypothetical protein